MFLNNSDISDLYTDLHHTEFYKFRSDRFHTILCSLRQPRTPVCKNGRGSNFLLHNQRMWNRSPPQERTLLRPNTPSLHKQSCIRRCRPHNRLARNTRNPPFPRILHTRRFLRRPSCRWRNSSPCRSLDRSILCRRPNSRSLHPKNNLYNLRYQDRILSLSHNLHWRICLSADSRHNRRIRNRPDTCNRRIRWTL